MIFGQSEIGLLIKIVTGKNECTLSDKISADKIFGGQIWCEVAKTFFDGFRLRSTDFGKNRGNLLRIFDLNLEIY